MPSDRENMLAAQAEALKEKAETVPADALAVMLQADAHRIRVLNAKARMWESLSMVVGVTCIILLVPIILASVVAIKLLWAMQ